MDDKKLRDIAARVSRNASPKVMRRKAVVGEIDFVSDLDALDAALAADNIVVRFENPSGGDPINFELRHMTPGEFAIYYQTLLGHTLLAANANPTGDAQTVSEMSEIDSEEAQRVQDELRVKKYDTRLLNILEGCLQNPPGITAERMRKWDAFYIMSLHNALLGGSRPSKSVAGFSELDNAGGE